MFFITYRKLIFNKLIYSIIPAFVLVGIPKIMTVFNTEICQYLSIDLFTFHSYLLNTTTISLVGKFFFTILINIIPINVIFLFGISNIIIGIGTVATIYKSLTIHYIGRIVEAICGSFINISWDLTLLTIFPTCNKFNILKFKYGFVAVVAIIIIIISNYLGWQLTVLTIGILSILSGIYICITSKKETVLLKDTFNFKQIISIISLSPLLVCGIILGSTLGTFLHCLSFHMNHNFILSSININSNYIKMLPFLLSFIINCTLPKKLNILKIFLCLYGVFFFIKSINFSLININLLSMMLINILYVFTNFTIPFITTNLIEKYPIYPVKSLTTIYLFVRSICTILVMRLLFYFEKQHLLSINIILYISFILIGLIVLYLYYLDYKKNGANNGDRTRGL